MIPTYGVNDSNGQSLIAVLVLLFFTFVLPALIMWFDEKRYVEPLEKEQNESDEYIHTGKHAH